MEIDGQPVEVDTRKATALLAFLAVTGEAHQRDTLAVLLWPEYDQSSARAALRRTLSTLNRGLHEAHLEISRERVSLARDSEIFLDVNQFRRLIHSTAGHGHEANEICPACLEPLQQAAELYREPFMAGFNLRDSPNFEEWQFFQEETLRRELAGVLEKLVHGMSAVNRLEEAIHFARRWLALDSLLEEAHRQLMILYNQAGQRNAALRQYRECIRILDEELGVAPLEETTRLYEAILNREPLPAGEGRLRFVAGSPVQANLAPPLAPAQEEAPVETGEAKPAARPLVGRSAEWQRLEDAFQNLLAGRAGAAQFLAVEGEAGIGKTHLAEAFLAHARGRGARVAQARCYAGETGLAYAVFIQAAGAALAMPGAARRLAELPPTVLAESGRLLPEIYSLAPGLPQQTLDGDGAQARFFEAVRQVLAALLAGPQPGVLFLDDLHWADAASLDLLTYLARRLRGTRLIILAAWRSEPGETVQALGRLSGELTRGGLVEHLHLERLNQDEVVELVRSHPGVSAEQAEWVGQRLYRESEGLPFIAVEYLAMLAQQAGSDGALAKDWAVPTSVRELLRSRLAGIDATAMQLLSTAAVIGRSFDFNTLREASGRSEFETVDGLDHLLEAGLVVEQNQERAGPPSQGAAPAVHDIAYDFTHEKLRELIYEETSLARRRLLHRRTAEALIHAQPGRAELAGRVAYHYEQAGLLPQAAEYHLLAGEHARRLFANTEAIAHFQAALAAGHPDPAGLHEAIGDLHVLRGEYNAALDRYRTAAALCQPGCAATLEHKLGNVHQRLGEWTLAESHYQASLEALEDQADPVFQVHLYADRSLAAYSQGDLNKAQALAEQALDLAQSCGDAQGMAQANNMLGMLARSRGQHEQAIAYLEASLTKAETLADPLARIAALNNLALVYRENAGQSPGDLERAIQLTQQALELCARRGDRHREAALHNNLADLLHQSGREDEAMAQLKQAVVIFAEIGGEQGAEETTNGARAEIWKLTEW